VDVILDETAVHCEHFIVDYDDRLRIKICLSNIRFINGPQSQSNATTTFRFMSVVRPYIIRSILLFTLLILNPRISTPLQKEQ